MANFDKIKLDGKVISLVDAAARAMAEAKQDRLTPGNGISIDNGVISATVEGGSNIVLDDTITADSTNGVTSKAIYTALDGKADKATIDTLLTKDKAAELYQPLGDYYTKTEVDNVVNSVYKFAGSVNTYDALPTDVTVAGTVYNVESDGMNYAWTGADWDALGGTVDISGLASKSDLSNYMYKCINNLSNNYINNLMSVSQIDGKTTYIEALHVSNTKIDDGFKTTLYQSPESQLQIGKPESNNVDVYMKPDGLHSVGSDGTSYNINLPTKSGTIALLDDVGSGSGSAGNAAKIVVPLVTIYLYTGSAYSSPSMSFTYHFGFSGCEGTVDSISSNQKKFSITYPKGVLFRPSINTEYFTRSCKEFDPNTENTEELTITHTTDTSVGLYIDVWGYAPEN